MKISSLTGGYLPDSFYIVDFVILAPIDNEIHISIYNTKHLRWHDFIKKDLDDDSLEKLIHIIPSAEEYVHASKEIYRALFRYYKNNTKDKIINIIRSFSGTLAGDFFEMLAHDLMMFCEKSVLNGIHRLFQITTAEKHVTKVNGLKLCYYVTTKGDKYKGWNANTE
ncbi:hypothetical protein RhiirC2_848653 [Rhizophagus irregularis]|uniref:Uncharacterized protein n=1 Tax=Rhizophagus irregularis TaxID=588596 RepID=A0A2N1NE78_9GLOM|nr:hypothetical protein RhiirC2_848653 [Rhizophagus irregularis]